MKEFQYVVNCSFNCIKGVTVGGEGRWEGVIYDGGCTLSELESVMLVY